MVQAAAAAQTDLSEDGEVPLLSATIEGLNRLVASEIIWGMGGNAILGLNSELVMKVGYDIDISHIFTLDYIRQQVPSIPTPETHGIL